MDSKKEFLTIPVAVMLGSFIIAISILVHGGIIKVGKLSTQTSPQPQQAQQAAPVQPEAPTVTINDIKALFTDKNLVFGDKNSKNLIVEVADPSCPYCHVAGGLNPELNKQIGPQFTLVSDGGTYVAPVLEIKKLVDSGKAGFVWLYTNGHGNGEMGTKAFYCANEQGKFWQAHDKLMTKEGYEVLNTQVKNDKTKSGDMATFLSSVLDQTALKNCLDSGKYDSKLSEDTALAQKLGISGTPGFFINTTKFAGAYSWKDMQSSVK